MACSAEARVLSLWLHVACWWTAGRGWCEAPGGARCFGLCPWPPRAQMEAAWSPERERVELTQNDPIFKPAEEMKGCGLLIDQSYQLFVERTARSLFTIPLLAKYF